MKKLEIPISINQLAFLQAYLYEIFSVEKNCNNSFKYTEWYCREYYSEDELKLIMDFFKGLGIKCDLDIIRKIDVQKLSGEINV